MFKKLLLMMLACLTALVFAGTGLAESDRPLQVVCTTFPQYDWARAILGEKDSGVKLTLLLDSGVDLHSYQPTAADIARISTCDLFIYVGGESDEWVEDVLAAAQTPSLHALSLLSCVEAREEETVEGMQESDHHHDTAFTLEDIQNRTLEDFGGKWVSLWPMLKAGQLDAFLRHKAGESDDPAVTVDSVREKYIAVWACDAVAITVEGDTISFDDGDGQPLRVSEYACAGYSANVRDDGEITVRYQFEAVSGDGPRYVQFNDHGHESGPAEHFHIYFGDDGFDALADSSTHPFFMPASLAPDQVLESLMEHGSHAEAEYDEHVWLSLRNAQAIVRVICEDLCSLNPRFAEVYTQNTEDYLAQLERLDAQYQSVADHAARRTLLFADRFPFRYLTEDYGLEYYAAFSGCSAEMEASFQTIAFLAQKVDELDLPVVLVLEGGDHSIAQTVAASAGKTDLPIATLNSLQSVTANDVQAGITYLDVMRANLDVLRQALE